MKKYEFFTQGRRGARKSFFLCGSASLREIIFFQPSGIIYFSRGDAVALGDFMVYPRGFA